MADPTSLTSSSDHSFADIPYGHLDRDYDFAAFSGDPKVYLIASLQRTSSYFLSYLLHATGSAGAPFEYLRPKTYAMLRQKCGTDTAAELLRCLFRFRTSPNGWFGLKAHPPQLQSARLSISDWKSLNLSKVIVLDRHDRIGQGISLYLAQQSGNWSSLHTNTIDVEYSFDAITAAINRLQNHRQYWTEFLEGLQIETLRLDYDDLTRQPLSALNACLNYLNIDGVQALPSVAITPQDRQKAQQFRVRFEQDASRRG